MIKGKRMKEGGKFGRQCGPSLPKNNPQGLLNNARSIDSDQMQQDAFLSQEKNPLGNVPITSSIIFIWLSLELYISVTLQMAR